MHVNKVKRKDTRRVLKSSSPPQRPHPQFVVVYSGETAAMSFTAAESSGLVIFLLFLPVIQGQDGWGVTYYSAKICALPGSTVDISCSYTYPASRYRISNRFWFTEMRHNEPVDLRTDYSDYYNRARYIDQYKHSTLRILNLKESDSAVYKFRFITNKKDGKYIGEPGVTLVVGDSDPGLQVQVRTSYHRSQLECHSSCFLAGGPSFIWYKNGTDIQEGTSSYYSVDFNSSDSYSCAVSGYPNHRSPSVYAPRVSIAMSSSGDIMEGSSVNLTCSIDANPAAKHTWFKNNQTVLLQGSQLVFISILSSDSGEYHCTAENELGTRTSQSVSVDVRYAPKLPSVSLSPSGQIVEGTSVTLTCSSDANPAANYTWYKEKQTVLQGAGGVHHFTSISSEDRGIYCCESDNQYGRINSTSLFLDVQYPPKLPSVSLSPSGQIVEGTSVNLTCSSDANPAANYTWYKEREESPKASGQMFTISEVTAGHSGGYYCEAWNSRGRSNSALCVIALPGSWRSAATGTITAALLAVVLLAGFLWMRSRGSKESNGGERPEDRAQVKFCPVRDVSTAAGHQDELLYSSICFPERQEDVLYSNIRLNHRGRTEEEEEEDEGVEYTAVKPASCVQRRQEDVEESFALYSTVNK